MDLEQFILQNYQQPISLKGLEPFLNERVFFNLDNPPSLPAGGSQQAKEGDALSIPTVPTSLGSAIVFYTLATDVRLQKPFAGVLLDEAIQIVHAMQAAKGILLQSSQMPALLIEKPSAGEVKLREASAKSIPQ
ncbi:hypothetical protein [Acidovorax cavernicola]|uniref:hypothetical protein n=1 Tax=Acidovorax cavernicola TaxID=1675792 RepID=UPI0011C459A6|nr:hypothetical protein [Acidovorax cavernicola]